MAETESEIQGEGITQRTIHKKKYRLESLEENEKLATELSEAIEKVKQPWRGKQYWVEKIRRRAAELEEKAPKWEDDPNGHNEYFAARDKEAWYFREMARLTRQIEREVQDCRAWDAVSSALQLGELITELRFKNDWEPAAIFGDEQMGKLKSGGESRVKHQPELVADFVKNLLDPNNTAGARNKTEAVSVAAEHFKIGKSTVYEKLRKVKESAPDASDRSE